MLQEQMMHFPRSEMTLGLEQTQCVHRGRIRNNLLPAVEQIA
jgi:hypothetical protein